VDDALSKGPSAFAQEFTGRVWGLHWTDAGFTAGTDNFTGAGVPAFTYGTSKDEGKSFNEAMSICDLKYDACGATSTVASACNMVYDDPAGGFLQDFTKGPRCVGAGGSSGADAGATPGAKKSDGGCACALSAPDTVGGKGPGLLAFVFSLLGLRALRRTRR
jgi:hypothetical protein